jgi:hypothetical protein
MANRKKSTARQRRKQAARAQPVQSGAPAEDTVVETSAKTIANAKSTGRPSWLGLDRWRRNADKNVPEKEPWTRLQITVFIFLAVLIQTLLSPIVVPAQSPLDSALVFVGPQMLLGALLAQPIARRLLHTRALGVLETLTVGATLSLLAFFAQYALVVPLVSPSSTPAATATSSPSPSTTSAPSSTPSPASTKTGATPAAKPATRTCPVDEPNCNNVVPNYEVETAEGLADGVGIILTIFMYSKIHRFFWMPRLRAKLREERSKKRASKSK